MIIGETTKLTFKLDVHGSNQPVKARVLLECSPTLVYGAVKGAGEWVAEIAVPSWVLPGTYGLSIEVILNNRIFTPLTRMVEITAMTQPEVTDVNVESDQLAEPEEQEVSPEPVKQPTVFPDAHLNDKIGQITSPIEVQKIIPVKGLLKS